LALRREDLRRDVRKRLLYVRLHLATARARLDAVDVGAGAGAAEKKFPAPGWEEPPPGPGPGQLPTQKGAVPLPCSQACSPWTQPAYVARM
jgi:hypothetical protein